METVEPVPPAKAIPRPMEPVELIEPIEPVEPTEPIAPPLKPADEVAAEDPADPSEGRLEAQDADVEPPSGRRVRQRRRRAAPASLDRPRRILREAQEIRRDEAESLAGGWNLNLDSGADVNVLETADTQPESVAPPADTGRQTELERLKELVDRLDFGDSERRD